MKPVDITINQAAEMIACKKTNFEAAHKKHEIRVLAYSQIKQAQAEGDTFTKAR